MQFKTYSKSLLDEHIELVQEVTKDWDWKPWYPSKEQLEAIYSREGFTPETRHYVYDKDLLVGFLSSAVEEEVEGIQYGSIHMLFIRKGYEQIEEELMKKTFAVLKDKGVQVIRTASIPRWESYCRTLEKWGFEKGTLLAQRIIFQPSTLLEHNYTPPKHIIEINIQQDKKKLVETIHLGSKHSKEDINNYLDKLITNKEYFASAIAMKEDDLVSYGLLTKGYSSKTAFLSQIPIQKVDHGHLLKDLFLFLVHKAYNLGIELLWHQMLDVSYTPYYSELNLKIEPFHQYQLTVSEEKKGKD